MANGNGNGGDSIRHTIIAPAHPGAIFAVMAKSLQLIRADWVLAPWEAMAEDEVIRKGVVDWAKTYIGLHGVETMHILFKPGFGGLAGRLYEELREYGLARDTQVEVDMKKINVLDVQPTATVFMCGDGRFSASRAMVFARYGFPRIITPPGEEQWLRDHPDFASRLNAWIDARDPVPRVVVKHKCCGYRDHKGSAPEREAAIIECSDTDTEYLWQPDGGHYEVLLPRRGFALHGSVPGLITAE